MSLKQSKQSRKAVLLSGEQLYLYLSNKTGNKLITEITADNQF